MKFKLLQNVNREKELGNLLLAAVVIILCLFVVVIGQAVIIERLEKQLLEYQEPSDLIYRYNFTRCVFEYGDKTAVCNLVMRNSCSEIKEIDQNCEVLE